MTATTHLLTTDRSRVQFIGVRGQWVISTYQQIARFLGTRLSQNHALLFAEPVVAAHAIDWFTAAEGEVQPFARLDEVSQTALLRQIQILVTDIQTLSQELGSSAQSDQQLIGEMLQGMLVFPDQSLFLVGVRPVVVEWGLKLAATGASWRVASLIQLKTGRGADLATPTVLAGVQKRQRPVDSPVPRIVRRQPVTSAPSTANAADIAVGAPMPALSNTTIDTTATLHHQGWWIGLLALLALGLLIASLRDCSEIAIQWREVTPAAPNILSAPPTVSEPTELLAATRQREYQLRQELARLQAELLEKRRACPARSR